MIRLLLRLGFENRWAVILGWLVLVVIGIRSLVHLPIEPFPDPDDVHVIVITRFPGKAPEEVETTVTRPLERAIVGAPGLTRLRSISMFGLSVITTTFDEHTDDWFARQQIFERLSEAELPPAVQPQLGPMSDSIGEIYRYTVEGPGWNILELKAIQDWVVSPALRAVPGVADVVPFGGGQKEYFAYVDPSRLLAYGVTLPEVHEALRRGNMNGGGSVVMRGDQEYTVRSIGLLDGAREAGRIAVTERNGTPIYVRDVARVERGTIPRRGFVGKDDEDDEVQGVVLLRKGENAVEVCNRVRARLDELNGHGLPRGVKLVPYYDRSYLVRHTLRTVFENDFHGLFLVLLVLVLFMGDLRSALIVVATIPLAVLFAFTVLHATGQTINLLSLGSVDFGIVVDGAVVMVEGIFVRLATAKPEDRARDLEAVVHELGPPIFFATLIIVLLNVPIFAFQRVEGRIFRPLALTVGLSIAGALLLALTLIPQLAILLLRPRPDVLTARASRWLVSRLARGYARLLALALARRRAVIGSALAVLALALAAASGLGTEFLPRLEEGNVWITATLPLSISAAEAVRVEKRIRDAIGGPYDRPPADRDFPEVDLVLSQLGRSEDGSEAKGINDLQIHVDLRPRDEWPERDVVDRATGGVERRPFTKEELVAALDDKLGVIPGVLYNFSQYIQDNVEEALSGVKGQVAVKVSGPDLVELQRVGERVRRSLERVPGVADLAVERLSGLPQLRVTVDRVRAARRGLNVDDVQRAVEVGIGGQVATTLIEGDRRFDLVTRLEREWRANPRRIASVVVPAPDGSSVPLGEIADVSIHEGAAQIRREALSRRIAVKCNVRGRDLGGFVREAMAIVQREIAERELKPGYTLAWEGEYENQRSAMARLRLIIPACVVLVFGLLYSTFRSLRTATLILATVPLALVGGVFGLRLMSIYLSVSAAIGFITLSGVAVQNGIILVSRIHTLRDRGGLDLELAILRGCTERLRPVLMTALTAALGFAPSVVSQGIGAEVRRPLATVVVFGILGATVFTLLVLPCLYRIFETGPVRAPGLDRGEVAS